MQPAFWSDDCAICQVVDGILRLKVDGRDIGFPVWYEIFRAFGVFLSPDDRCILVLGSGLKNYKRRRGGGVEEVSR